MTFEISYKGQLIGTSRLETGDPSMGVASGVFIPNKAYMNFKANVLPYDSSDSEMTIWNGFSVRQQSGVKIECVEVAVFDFGDVDAIEPLVDVLGISKPSYEELFPGRAKEYDNRLRDGE